MASLLERVRVVVPPDKIIHKGKAGDFFDIYKNSQGLTEEFLYAHQPTTLVTVPVYSTSDTPIGFLDDSDVASQFNIVSGPAVVVARKGYAGRLYVLEAGRFIVHEDAYPIKPKDAYAQDINLWWFVGHYSLQFQADRTSFWGIGDFPRARFLTQDLVIPDVNFQEEVSVLYRQRMALLGSIDQFKDEVLTTIDELVIRETGGPSHRQL